MKLSVVTFAILMAVSSFTSAKTSYVDGEIKHVSVEKKTISIVEQDSGEVKNFKVDNKVKKKMEKFKEGDSVLLKLESAKFEK